MLWRLPGRRITATVRRTPARPSSSSTVLECLEATASAQHLFTSQQYQLDDLTWTHGAGEIAFGGRFPVDPAYEQPEQNLNGRFGCNSLQAFLNNQPRRFQQSFVTGNTLYRGTVREFAFYATVRAELHPHLYLTAGRTLGRAVEPAAKLTNSALSVTHSQ